ncbi:VTC domain-containing protein [Pyxidicoccus fallax]|uniref:VTC domain-containing protein n=1 Tax=Pyxidicoccus fallax TaxID=394095 RepID=A0A848M048_9BACT|nr:VTC domain-containing protein [Pyxidicoccus fallax]NMO23220.1 VTC domain-containing protein [Pyxidicoccus fallax]NPC83835.1 VTC domain-containing protein [Pyxidicoccus fallax]
MLSFAEGEVTKLRREFKLVLEEDMARTLCTRLSVELGGHLPPPTRIVSVYFDRPGCPLASRALRTPDDCLKVRTKEYSPDLGAGGVQRVVLEVKRERHGLTQKRRVWVPRSELGRVIRGGGASLLPLFSGGSLVPVLAVTYKRHVYQATQAWRVTVDRDIGFHTITSELALSQLPLTAERLGPPHSADSRVVVEVKHLGHELPEWLASLNPGGAPAYSKFAEGMARVHAFARDGVVGG